MWKGHLFSLIRRSAPLSSRVAAGAAVSCILLTDLYKQCDDKLDDLPSRRLHDGNISLVRSIRSLSQHILLPQTLRNREVTLCDAGRHARLARHRTLRRIEETSSQSTLESRYDVNWSNPLGEGAFGAVYLAKDRKVRGQVRSETVYNRDDFVQ